MKATRVAVAAALLLAALASARADEDGFVPLFDGKTLKGWVNVSCVRDLEGRKGEIITTGQPIGICAPRSSTRTSSSSSVDAHQQGQGQQLRPVRLGRRTACRRHRLRGASRCKCWSTSSTRTRRPAVTATSHGDVFSIHGASCKPDRPHPLGSRCLPSEYNARRRRVEPLQGDRQRRRHQAARQRQGGFRRRGAIRGSYLARSRGRRVSLAT
jgi:hypothetical protein